MSNLFSPYQLWLGLGESKGVATTLFRICLKKPTHCLSHLKKRCPFSVSSSKNEELPSLTLELQPNLWLSPSLCPSKSFISWPVATSTNLGCNSHLFKIQHSLNVCNRISKKSQFPIIFHKVFFNKTFKWKVVCLFPPSFQRGLWFPYQVTGYDHRHDLPTHRPGYHQPPGPGRTLGVMHPWWSVKPFFAPTWFKKIVLIYIYIYITIELYITIVL